MVAAGARIGGSEALSWGALPPPLFSLRMGWNLEKILGKWPELDLAGL